jgi:hypothetical protein
MFSSTKPWLVYVFKNNIKNTLIIYRYVGVYDGFEPMSIFTQSWYSRMLLH